ncbi:MAG: hypothetical protein LT070_00385 [Solirubrobacteraceae bacterium]|nr:hypothetical protein [Solirubrobacteraceae bacterium]
MSDLRETAHNSEAPTALLRVRMSSSEARYAGGLVDGASITALFGDLATELSIRHDGDEGLFRAYEEIEFLAPVHAGDYIEARAWLLHVGHTSRRVAFEAWKQITAAPEAGDSAAAVLPAPVLVARAVGTVVTPLERQRRLPTTA